MKESISEKIKYKLYLLACWFFGHKYSCCNEITKNCKDCRWCALEEIKQGRKNWN